MSKNNVKTIIFLLLVFPVVLFSGCTSQHETKVNEIQAPPEEPDVEQIQAEIVGSNLRWKNGKEVWYFRALSEFKNVSINNKVYRGDAIEYDVTFLLHDFELEKDFRLEAFLVFRIIDNKWQFWTYLVTDFKDVTLDRHIE